MNNPIDWRRLCDEAYLCTEAQKALKQPFLHITDARAARSEGGPNDFYSNGDYWWPNPQTQDGLPYVVRDGESNPDNFNAHRTILREMHHRVAHLAAAFCFTGQMPYAAAAIRQLDAFFVQPQTRMNPSLWYAQAIPGVCAGRGIGIIDTLQLVDVTQAAALLRSHMPKPLYTALQEWFAEYLHWMNTSPNGIEERDWHNNHAVAWTVQAAAFASFTENERMLEFCRRQYTDVFLREQMAQDGSFPHELARTKPYSYSCFVLDCMTNLCLLASDPAHDLWSVCLSDGRSIAKGLSFLYPYLVDITQWPFDKDLHHFEHFPVAMPFLLFGGLQLEEKYLALWKQLNQHPAQQELQRITAMAYPLLYCMR